MSIRVLIADDQALVRGGFRMILQPEPDIEVIAEADNGTTAVAAARALTPDVVLMDIRMPGLDGIAATRAILETPLPQTRVLVVTTFNLDEYVYEALCAGASGFLLKNSAPEQLIEGVRVVAAGDAILTPSITRHVIENFNRQTPRPTTTPPSLDELTPRELEVLKLIAKGLSNAEIARDLKITDATAKTHVRRILMKLHLRDRVQAVVLAYETGLVRADPAAD